MTTKSKKVVVLGNFDGVHVAHQELLLVAADIAKKNMTEAMVVTFDPHPKKVLLHGEYPVLNNLQERLTLIKKSGVASIKVLKFDEEFAKISAADFLRMLLEDYQAGWIVSGYNFYFGHQRQGSPQMLYASAAKLGFQYHQVHKITQNGLDVSSSTIKNLLDMGAMGLASEMLGHPYVLPMVNFAVQNETTVMPYDPSCYHPVCGSYACEIAILGDDDPKLSSCAFGVLEIDRALKQNRFTIAQKNANISMIGGQMKCIVHALLHPKRCFANAATRAKQEAINLNETKYFFSK